MGGNPSVGGGGFAASPAGTAPLYYKSAEIASGSAKNLCKKSGDVGGCALRGTGSTCRCGKLNGELAPALPTRRASAIPGGGACPVGRPPTLPLPSFLPPIPPAPFPQRGRGRFIVILCKGLRPRHPGLNLRGTGLSRCSDCLGWHFPWNRHKRRPNNRFIREKFWGVWGTLSRVPQRFPRRIRRDFFLKTSCFFSADGV